MRGRGQSIFKIVGAIIQSRICYLLLTKRDANFIFEAYDILKISFNKYY